MCLTDFCHLNDAEHPRAVRSRFARIAFATRDAPRQSEAVTSHDRGNGRFTTPETASARRFERGVACSATAIDSIELLTPLSRLPLS
jgi:hypothetical protein